MECNKDADDFYDSSVIVLTLLLKDINASMEIFNNISVIISTKKYDVYTSLSFSTHSSSLYSKSLR